MKIVTLSGEIKEVKEELIKYEIAMGICDEYYNFDLAIDDEDGSILGIVMTKYLELAECEYLRGLIDSEFKREFYIVPLYREYLERYYSSSNELYLEKDFHIWPRGTSYVCIEDWFTDNDLGYYECEDYLIDYSNMYS